MYDTLVRCSTFEGDWETLVCRIGTCDPHDLVRHILVSGIFMDDYGLRLGGYRVQRSGWSRVHDNRIRRTSSS